MVVSWGFEFPPESSAGRRESLNVAFSVKPGRSSE